MEFNFQPVEKMKGLEGIPSGTVRVRKVGIGVATNIVNFWQETRAPHKNNKENGLGNQASTESAKVAIEYDRDNDALRLTESPSGFACSISKRFGSGYIAQSTAFKKLGVKKGDYRLVDGTSNIFRLEQANV